MGFNSAFKGLMGPIYLASTPPPTDLATAMS